MENKKKEVEREWEKRKGNLSFLSLHKTLSFLAWAVNIFRFRLRTVSDCESVTVTVTFAVTLCGISNDFFHKSRQSGRGGGRGELGGSALRRASRSLLNVYALLNLISLPHSLARLASCVKRQPRLTGRKGGQGERETDLCPEQVLD